MIKGLVCKQVNLAQPELIKVAIVQSSYHFELNANMTEYCTETLVNNNLLRENISVFPAPGSWEVPLIVKKLAATKKYDAIVAFGIIIKGDTYHFDTIANETARSLMETSIAYEIPVGFEILAVYNLAQAESRASKDNYNKGIEAGNAILEAIASLRSIN